MLDIEHPYDDNWWRIGAPDWIWSCLSEDEMVLNDLSTYKSLEDMLADRSQNADMFSKDPKLTIRPGR